VTWTIEDERSWNLNNSFRNFLGIEIERIDGDKALISLQISERLLQSYGIVHGGIYCVLIDAVMGTSVRGGVWL